MPACQEYRLKNRLCCVLSLVAKGNIKELGGQGGEGRNTFGMHCMYMHTITGIVHYKLWKEN